MKTLRFIFAAALAVAVFHSAIAADWVYDSAAGQISDGVWTFKATVAKNSTNLTVSNIIDDTAPAEISPLDFSKRVVKSGDESVEYTIVAINALFYYYSGGEHFHAGADKVGEFTLPGEGLVTMGGDGLRSNNGTTAYGDIVIPSTVTSIGRGWFYRSKITSITFPASTISIAGGYSLGICQGCTELTSVTFPADGNYTLVDGFTFSGCTGIEEADISGVVSMSTGKETDASRAHFNGCTSLKRLIVGTKLERFVPNVVLNGNTSLETVWFLGAPPAEFGKPFLGEIANTQSVTTIVPLEKVDDWKIYAANGEIADEGTTWDAEYVKSGVALANRPLIYYTDPATRPPKITSVEIGQTSTNSIEIVVSGEQLNGGAVTIFLDDGVNPPVSSDELDDFGSYVFTMLLPNKEYTVWACATNAYGDVSSEPIVTGTYGVTTLAARMYYVNRTRTATFVYDNIDRSPAAGVQQFELGETGGMRDWRVSNTGLIDGFNPVMAVFDVSFKQFKPTDLSYLFWKWGAMSSIEGLENLDTSASTSMKDMFYHVDAMTELDLSGFKTGNVSDMGDMFQWSAKLVTIYANENFTTERINPPVDLFSGDTLLIGGNGTKFSNEHKLSDYAVVDTEATPGYFTYKDPPARKPEIAAVVVACGGLSNVTVTVSGSDLQGGTVTVKLMDGDVEKMSVQSESFGEFAIDGLDEGTTYTVVVNAENASGISTDDGNTFTTWVRTTLGARVVYTDSDRTMAFYYDEIDRSSTATWTVDIGEDGARTWGTPNKTDWVHDDSVARISFDSSFAAFRPKTCSQWFARMGDNSGVVIEGIEFLNTSDVTSLYRMFYNFRSKGNVDLVGFRTAKVTTMEQMFGYGGWAMMDLSSFDTRNVTKVSQMFIGSKANTIYASERFVTTAVTSGGEMFVNCKQLEGENGTRAYIDNVATGNPLDYTYARIDDPEHGAPGYFTYKAPPADKTGLVILFR